METSESKAQARHIACLPTLLRVGNSITASFSVVKGARIKSSWFRLLGCRTRFRVEYYPFGHHSSSENYCSAYVRSEEAICAQLEVHVNEDAMMIDRMQPVPWQVRRCRGYKNFCLSPQGRVFIKVSSVRMPVAPWRKVEVLDPFTSPDELTLQAGLNGAVEQIDSDGDARIRFKDGPSCWVFTKNSHISMSLCPLLSAAHAVRIGNFLTASCYEAFWVVAVMALFVRLGTQIGIARWR